jgi:hypothetical protein
VWPPAKVSGVWPSNDAASCRVVVRLEVRQLPFKVTGIPKQHMVEKVSSHRSDQALDRGRRHRDATAEDAVARFFPPPRQHEGVNFQRVGHGLHFDALQLTELDRLKFELETVSLDFLRTHTTGHGHLLVLGGSVYFIEGRSSIRRWTMLGARLAAMFTVNRFALGSVLRMSDLIGDVVQQLPCGVLQSHDLVNEIAKMLDAIVVVQWRDFGV